MNTDSIPCHKSILTHEVSETDEVVIYDKHTRQLLVLNDIGAGVWLLIDGERTLSAIADEVVSACGVEKNIATQDVLSFVADLERRDLLDWQRPQVS